MRCGIIGILDFLTFELVIKVHSNLFIPELQFIMPAGTMKVQSLGMEPE